MRQLGSKITFKTSSGSSSAAPDIRALYDVNGGQDMIEDGFPQCWESEVRFEAGDLHFAPGCFGIAGSKTSIRVSLISQTCLNGLLFQHSFLTLNPVEERKIGKIYP